MVISSGPAKGQDSGTTFWSAVLLKCSRLKQKGTKRRFQAPTLARTVPALTQAGLSPGPHPTQTRGRGKGGRPGKLGHPTGPACKSLCPQQPEAAAQLVPFWRRIPKRHKLKPKCSNKHVLLGCLAKWTMEPGICRAHPGGCQVAVPPLG